MLAADRRIWESSIYARFFLPLEVQNEIIGAINSFRISNNLVLTENDIKEDSAILSLLATAINNARMAEETITAKNVEAVNKELKNLPIWMD
ncbi:MAG: hypothetical protein R2875_16985 [Desulfobacterales bacterium]